MSRDQVDTLVENLHGEEGRLQAELKELAERRKAVEAQLAKIGDAVAALTGKAAKRGSRRKSRKRSSPRASGSTAKTSAAAKSSTASSPAAASAAPPLDRARVVALAAEVLEAAGGLPEIELERRVRSRLGEEGQRVEGLSEALRSALREPRFTESLRGWTLREHTIPARNREPELETTV